MMKLLSISLIAPALAATVGSTFAAPGPHHAHCLEQVRDVDSVCLFTRNPADPGYQWQLPHPQDPNQVQDIPPPYHRAPHPEQPNQAQAYLARPQAPHPQPPNRAYLPPAYHQAYLDQFTGPHAPHPNWAQAYPHQPPPNQARTYLHQLAEPHPNQAQAYPHQLADSQAHHSNQAQAYPPQPAHAQRSKTTTPDLAQAHWDAGCSLRAAQHDARYAKKVIPEKIWRYRRLGKEFKEKADIHFEKHRKLAGGEPAKYAWQSKKSAEDGKMEGEMASDKIWAEMEAKHPGITDHPLRGRYAKVQDIDAFLQQQKQQQRAGQQHPGQQHQTGQQRHPDGHHHPGHQ